MDILLAIGSFLMPLLTILVLAFIQNTSFSIVSRSRNRNNMKYHLIAAAFSNTIWFLTFRMLVKGDMNLILFLPYCCGTMLGSVFGVKISMFFEKLLGAEADGHLKSKITADDIAEYLDYIDAHCDRRPQMRFWKFRQWLEYKNSNEICPGCKINLIDENRDGCCVDCSH